MRALILMLLAGSAATAVAQESPPASVPSYPVAQPPPPSAPSSPSSSSSSSSLSLSLQSPSATVSMAPPRSLSPETVSRWHGARALQVAGGVIGLLSTGLSLSSTIYVVATGYPPKADDFLHPAKPTDTGPILAYVASATSVLGFGLSAGGLGWQHHILDELGADTGRGVYVGGTVLGILGTVATASGYFLAFTDYLNPHDQSISLLVTTLTGAALCTTASLMYAVDSSRMKRAWRNLSSF